MIHSIHKRCILLIFPEYKVDYAQDDEIKREKGGRSDEGEEVSVITTSNAVVQPYAMVVLRFDTAVAHLAVVASRRTPDTAAPAVLDRHFEVNVGGARWANQSPAIDWRDGKRIIHIIGFHNMEVTRIRLCRVSGYPK
jgi:hypothetical protein